MGVQIRKDESDHINKMAFSFLAGGRLQYTRENLTFFMWNCLEFSRLHCFEQLEVDYCSLDDLNAKNLTLA